jgi:hypothetical protein
MTRAVLFLGVTMCSLGCFARTPLLSNAQGDTEAADGGPQTPAASDGSSDGRGQNSPDTMKQEGPRDLAPDRTPSPSDLPRDVRDGPGDRMPPPPDMHTNPMAVEQCRAIVRILCRRLAQCTASSSMPIDENSCKVAVEQTFPCQNVMKVGPTYDRCLNDLNSWSCARLLPMGQLVLPMACINALN